MIVKTSCANPRSTDSGSALTRRVSAFESRSSAGSGNLPPLTGTDQVVIEPVAP